ncbi:MAG: type II secretion system protein [Candidatus Sungbacteria bacterium]|nr:type II secretion system protein [Candidatus Sungbacteria bacterium]
MKECIDGFVRAMRDHLCIRVQVGFTLLETIIALGVILGGIVGPYTLATRGVISSSTAKDKLIALNLSQEGIELVRHLRENNILEGQPWHKGISKNDGGGGPDCEAGYQISAIDEDGNLGELECYRDLPMYYYGNTGLNLPLYVHSNQMYGILGKETVYKRRVEVMHPIPASSDYYTPGVPPSDQMLIRVTVEWQTRSFTQSIALEEVMFDWE